MKKIGSAGVLSGEHMVHAVAVGLDKATTLMQRHLTHWGRVTYICVSKLTIIGSDNGLSPGRRQAIIRTNAGKLLIRPLWTHFSELLIEMYTFSFKKIHLKMSSGNGDHFVSASMSLQRRARRPFLRADDYRGCMSFKWTIKCI